MNSGNGPIKPMDRAAYDKARKIADFGDVEARRKLAADTTAAPEILYYLASDENLEVRQALASNAMTPLQADFLLSYDKEAAIRIELAAKIGIKFENLGANEQSSLFTDLNKVLGQLVNDRLYAVREIVAEEVQLLSNVPRGVISKLAHDAETSVAVPILEHSPLLEDSELIEIITEGVREEMVVARAPRKNLPDSVLRRMAGFVGAAIVEMLVARYPLAVESKKQLRAAVRKRIENEDFSSLPHSNQHPERYQILVAEDDTHMRMMVGQIIESFFDAEVTAVDDGDKALHKIVEGYSYDLIICDWMMPYMSGIKFLSTVRSRGIDTPFVMLTSRKDVDSIVEAKAAGVDAFITKPVTADEIHNKLRTLLKPK